MLVLASYGIILKDKIVNAEECISYHVKKKDIDMNNEKIWEEASQIIMDDYDWDISKDFPRFENKEIIVYLSQDVIIHEEREDFCIHGSNSLQQLIDYVNETL